MAWAHKALAAAIIGGAILATPAAAGGRHDRSEFYVEIDRGPYDRLGTRIHRTALEDGYFGQGARHDGRGGYDYDRGYPYDYYSGDRRDEGYEDGGYDEPREVRCDTEWTRDHDRREEVPVTVCRG
jgi:hypothetical protein